MTIKADLGFINIAPEVLADIAGYAAMSCFGVKGMTIRSVSDGIAHLLRRENILLWNMASTLRPSAVRLLTKSATM